MATAEEISQVINAIRALSGAGICFYDLNTPFRYGKLGEQNNRGHYCELCRHTRLLEGGRAACNHSHRTEAYQMALDYKRPFFFKCHMGLCELVLPLFDGGELMGLIFIGQCRVQGEDARTDVRRRAKRLGGDPDRFEGLYDALPECSQNRLLDSGTVLMHYFEGLIEVERREWLRHPANEAPRTTMERIAEHVRYKYMLPITSGEICKQFHLHPSYVAREFKKHTGYTLTAYIHLIRTENAARLLTATALPVESIALNVGFYDANYFSRVFKRQMGVSPEIYRKARKG